MKKRKALQAAKKASQNAASAIPKLNPEQKRIVLSVLEKDESTQFLVDVVRGDE